MREKGSKGGGGERDSWPYKEKLFLHARDVDLGQVSRGYQDVAGSG